MRCNRCNDDSMSLLVTRQDGTDRFIQTYFCDYCLSYVNIYLDNGILKKEEWGDIHGRKRQ